MLPVYDPMTAALGITHVYRRLLAHADIHPGDRVLDIGCGTGTLTVLAKQVHSRASVTGLDPDSAALDRARAKARARGLAVHFDVGYGGALPYPTGAFDRVLSSFMAHHLLGEERQKTLAEVLRVLTATGSLQRGGEVVASPEVDEVQRPGRRRHPHPRKSLARRPRHDHRHGRAVAEAVPLPQPGPLDRALPGGGTEAFSGGLVSCSVRLSAAGCCERP